jgi:hypothetical protein
MGDGGDAKIPPYSNLLDVGTMAASPDDSIVHQNRIRETDEDDEIPPHSDPPHHSHWLYEEEL